MGSNLTEGGFKFWQRFYLEMLTGESEEGWREVVTRLDSWFFQTPRHNIFSREGKKVGEIAMKLTTTMMTLMRKREQRWWWKWWRLRCDCGKLRSPSWAQSHFSTWFPTQTQTSNDEDGFDVEVSSQQSSFWKISSSSALSGNPTPRPTLTLVANFGKRPNALNVKFRIVFQ